MRKRRVGVTLSDNSFNLEKACEYISENQTITRSNYFWRDPFLLEDERIEEILCSIRGIKHIEVTRIHTRIPCVLPNVLRQILLQC
jgi:lysine 2,3-aminomutase